MSTDPHTVALRCAGPTLLELPRPSAPRGRVWVAMIRSEPRHPDGWARQPWRPAPDSGGWTIPATCVFGTVVEFGTDITAGRRRDRRPVRWYGIAVAHEPDWLILHGPHPHPTDAERTASLWLTTARAYAVSLHDPTADEQPSPTRRPNLTTSDASRQASTTAARSTTSDTQPPTHADVLP